MDFESYRSRISRSNKEYTSASLIDLESKEDELVKIENNLVAIV